jgi:AraC-like DNA-binding protein
MNTFKISNAFHAGLKAAGIDPAEITEVAKELGMSSRTLQRRITDEGTSFRHLYDAQ